MSSSSLGRGIGAGTDGRDASEKHQRDFIPANVVTHEEVTEGHELLALELLDGEKFSRFRGGPRLGTPTPFPHTSLLFPLPERSHCDAPALSRSPQMAEQG